MFTLDCGDLHRIELEEYKGRIELTVIDKWGQKRIVVPLRSEDAVKLYHALGALALE